MISKIRPRIICSLVATLLLSATAQADVESEWSGSISLDTRLFFHDNIHAGQNQQNISLSIEPEYYKDWSNGDQRLVFHPFFRYDANDDERTHADLREFYWRATYGDIELKVGAAKVFWGVAESNHLVDIINQTDLIENVDGEDKLGQPMLNFAAVKDWGTLELFALPYFRERTFAGREGRLRSAYVVDTDNASYESGAKEYHVDFAVRWSHYVGDWDIGLAHFSGTSREPTLIAMLDGNGKLVLIPHYQQIDQTSIDIQATKGDWLWKLEAISSRNDAGRYTALVGGFEYTLVGVLGGINDVGILLEYHFDDRGNNATLPFQNDVFVGIRWVKNDAQSTEVLGGVIVDADSQAMFGNIEASRRIGDAWKISLEARLFANQDHKELLFDMRDDDYIELQFTRYF